MQMCETKEYLLPEVNPGMILGKTIYTVDGKTILNEGTILTDSLKKYLEHWKVQTVQVKESRKGEPLTVKKGELLTQTRFYKEYKHVVDLLKQSFEEIRASKEIPLEKMQEIATGSIAPLINEEKAVSELLAGNPWDYYTFYHSVNVAVLSGMLGKWLGYSGDMLCNLILAGLLHDVGKSEIPIRILNKPSQLTWDEMEIMKMHTIYGYQLLQSASNVTMRVRLGVMQHHERLDGSGYPLKLTGGNIHQFAKIIAVADIYDAMTSDRVYRRKFTPFIVVEELFRDMFGKLDPTVCTTFLNNIRDYYIGNIVRLNDGREAKVVYIEKRLSSRPMVQTSAGDFIDLEQNKAIDIIELLAI